MGYPVIAKIANLPSEISNGQGLGGGSVVGWLPIVCHSFLCKIIFINFIFIQVEEDEGEKGKKAYIDFK